MSIKINIDPHLLENHSNNTVVEVRGNTVGECLVHLVKQLPTIKSVIFDKDGNLSSAININVNLEKIWIEKLAEPVKDGDEISISPEEAVGCN
jgi:molybdopterin converting factor small subunit